MKTRFEFDRRMGDGGTSYVADHELHNVVRITFPPGYWDGPVHAAALPHKEVYPSWVDIDFDTLSWPEYREPPIMEVVKELQRRMPNLMVEHMHPGFVAVHIGKTRLIACGGDSDGWRLEHQTVDGTCDDIDIIDTELKPLEQDVNLIVTTLINLFRRSPWADDIFGACVG